MFWGYPFLSLDSESVSSLHSATRPAFLKITCVFPSCLLRGTSQLSPVNPPTVSQCGTAVLGSGGQQWSVDVLLPIATWNMRSEGDSGLPMLFSGCSAMLGAMHPGVRQ